MRQQDNKYRTETQSKPFTVKYNSAIYFRSRILFLRIHTHCLE